MINSVGIKIVTGLFLGFVSFSAQAVNCGDASPNLAQDGDLYYDIVGAGALTNRQKSQIKKLLSLIDGRWEGAGVKSHCVGNNMRTFNYTLKANVRQGSDGKIIFNLNSLESQTKTLRDETLRFLGSGNQYHITKLNEGSLGLYVKYRRPNANRKMTIFVEEIVEIKGSEKKLSLNITRYLNGYFSETFSREFYR